MIESLKPWHILGTNYLPDDFIEMIFNHYINRLNKRFRVYKINGLRDENKKLLCGRIRKKCLYIRNRMSRQETLKTLIHEIAHALFASAEEDTVKEIERILWARFKDHHKLILEKYIPKSPSISLTRVKAAHTYP